METREISSHLQGGGERINWYLDRIRPISLLAAVSKLAEKVVQLQICKHMDQYKLWHGSIHSYRKTLSSTTALAQVCDEIFAASDEKKNSLSYPQWMKVRHSTRLNHEILIQKLRMYKLHEDTVDWIYKTTSAIGPSM